MDIVELDRLFNDLIKQYQTTETQCILFYSSDKERDFKILEEKVKQYRKRLNIVLADSIIEPILRGDESEQ